MANTFVPIASLPLLPSPPSLGMEMAIQAAGVTWKVDARSFPLPTDTFITWQDQVADLVNSRVLTAGSGISINYAVPGQVIITSSGASGGPIFFNNYVVDVAVAGNNNNFNPGAWAGGLDRSGMRLTTSGGAPTITGIDTSAMLDGQTFQLMNLDTIETITLAHQSVLSSANNRFALPLNSDFSLLPGQCVEVVFETTTNRLRILT